MSDALLSAVLRLRPELDPVLMEADGAKAGELYGKGFNKTSKETLAKGAGAGGAGGGIPGLPGGKDHTKIPESKKPWYQQKDAGLTSLMGPSKAVVATGVAVAAFAVDMGMKIQKATVDLQNYMGVSAASAKATADAFVTSGTASEFTANEQVAALAAVAGQLKTTQGAALTTSQDMKFMANATDLATATHTDLATSTSTLSGLMQAFGIKVKGAAGATNVLYTDSKDTGMGIDTLAQTFERLHARLGALSPSIKGLGGLLLDFTKHGEAGHAALTGMSSLYNTILKPAAAYTKALADQKNALGQLPASLQGLAANYQNMSSKELTHATKGMTEQQKVLWQQYVTTSKAVDTAKLKTEALGITVTNAQGKFVGTGAVLDQLNQKIKGMSNHQAVAELQSLGFGNAAAMLVPVIQAGGSAFDKSTASVSKSNSAHDAAERASKTLAIQLKETMVMVENFATKVGEILIPVLQKVLGVFIKVGEFILKHKPLLITLGIIFGTVFVAALALLTTALIANTVAWVSDGVAAAGALLGITTGLAEEEVAATTAWAATLGPIAIIIAAVAAFAFAIYEIVKHWKTISHFFEKLWGDVLSILKWAFHHIGEIILVLFVPEVLIFKYWRQISNFFVKLWGDVTEVLKWAWKHIGIYILEFFVPEVLIFKYWTPITLFFSKLWNGVKNGVSGLIKDIVKFFIDLPGEIAKAIESGAGQVMKALEHLIPGGGIIGDVFHGASSLFHGIFGGGSSPTPTHATSGGSSTHTTIHQTIHIDARGANPKAIADALKNHGDSAAARRPSTQRYTVGS